MDEPADIPPRSARDFSFIVGCSAGGQLRQAKMVSSSRAGSLDDQSLWQTAVLSEEEYQRVIEVLTACKCVFRPGAYVGDEPEYYVNMMADGKVFSCALGLDWQTRYVLELIRDALDASHRGAIQPLVDDVKGLLEERHR